MPSTVPHASRGPVLFGVRNNRTVWPAISQPCLDNMPVPAVLPPPPSTGLLFAADFDTAGMARYQANNIANNGAVLDVDYGIAADPTGTGQVVGWCDNVGKKTNTNSYARSQMLTRRWVYPARRGDMWGEYAQLTEFYIDPVSALSTADDWFSIHGFHGPAFIGPSSTGLMVVFNPKTGKHYFRMGNAVGRIPEAAATVPVGAWFQVLIMFRYAAAADGGWVDLYLNTTPDPVNGWQRIPVDGGFRAPFDMVSDDEGNAWLTDPTRGPSYASWGCYGSHRALVYCRQHRLGTTVRSVMPPGWGGTIAGVRFGDGISEYTPPAPTTPAYTPNPSGGSGGAFADSLANSYTSGSLTSRYHLRAAHVSAASGPVPLVIHLHGDGYEEYTNMAAGSTTSVGNYYTQVAHDAGAIIVIPRTPDTSSATWWKLQSSTTWLMALYNRIVSQYNIDLNRVFWSGYSGGAEEITYNVTADYNNRWTGGGAMILGGGGAEGMTGFAVTPTAAFKQNFPMEWHVGELDTDDGTGWSAVGASSEGEAFYRTRGFTTGRYLVPGADHVATEPHGPYRLQNVIANRYKQLGITPNPNPPRVTVTANTSTSVLSATTDKTIPAPASKAGDLLVLFLAVYGTGVANAALPSGFTTLGTRTRGTNHRLIIGTRVATGTEPAGSWTPTIPSGVTHRADVLTVTNADTTKVGTPVFAETAAATTHRAPSITPTTKQGAIISAVSGAGGNSWKCDPWMVEQTDQATPSPYLTLATAEQPTMTTNATGTKVFTASAGSYTHLTATLYLPSKTPAVTEPGGTDSGATPLPSSPARRAVVLGTSHSDTTWTQAGGVWWWQMAADRAGLTVLDSYAVGGMDTPGALNGWSGATPQIVSAEKSTADLAIVEFGGNDVKNGVTADQYAANLTTMANRLKATGKRVIFVFPPPLFAEMKAGSDATYMAFRERMKQVAAATGSYYADAWDALKDPATGACRTAYDSGDHVHLNGDGQLAFGAAVAPAIQSFAGVTDPYDGTRDVYWFGGNTTQGDVAQVVQGTNPTDALFKGGAGAVLSGGADVAVFYQIGSTPGDRYEVAYAYRVESAGSAAAFQATVDWPAATQKNYPQRDRLVGQYGVRRREVTIPPEATAGRVYALDLAAGTGTRLRIGPLGIKKL